MPTRRPALNVLMVEDDHISANLVRTILKHCNGSLNLEVVESVKEAEGRAEVGGVDIILLDLGLKDSDGMASLKAVVTSFPHCPIVVVTGNDDPDLAAECLAHGAVDYLVKGSYDVSSLYSKILQHTSSNRHIKTVLDMDEKLIRLTVQVAEIALSTKRNRRDSTVIKRLLMQGKGEEPSLVFRVVRLEKDMASNWTVTRAIQQEEVRGRWAFRASLTGAAIAIATAITSGVFLLLKR